MNLDRHRLAARKRPLDDVKRDVKRMKGKASEIITASECATGQGALRSMRTEGDVDFDPLCCTEPVTLNQLGAQDAPT